MPHSVEKLAGVTAKSYADLVDILKKSGHNLSKPAEEVADHMMFKGRGSGSFVLDAAKWPIKKTKLGQNLNKAVDSAQRKISDLDIKAGNGVVKAINKQPFEKAKKLADNFISKHHVNTTSSPNGVPDKLLEVNVPTLTAPINKVKDTVIPIAGSFAIADAMTKPKKQVQNVQEKTSSEIDKKLLLEKVASFINKSSMEKFALEHQRESELLKTASLAIRSMAQEKREIQEQLEKVAIEYELVKLELYERDRREDAEKLANEMLNKGIIKVSEVDDKVEGFIKLSDETLSVLKETVANCHFSQKNNNDGIDSLNYLMDDGNIKIKKDLADSIDDAIDELKLR